MAKTWGVENGYWYALLGASGLAALVIFKPKFAMAMLDKIKGRKMIDDNTSDDSSSSDSSDSSDSFNDPHYPPHADKTVALFTAAAKQAGLPEEWASSIDLHELLHSESAGWVGIPNYCFGKFWGGTDRDQWPIIWAAIRDGTWRSLITDPRCAGDKASSATGLGQLTLTNISSGNYYPSGVDGIGNALEEAIGMLRYIKGHTFDIDARKVRPGEGDPASAWAFHQAIGWY